MKIWFRAIAFFRVVPLHSFYLLGGLGALSGFGAVMLVMEPSQGTDVIVPILLLHMFAVSSGFAVPARRGHFDFLLAGGVPRFAVAVAHWLLSAAPGLLAWFALGVFEAVLGQGTHGAAFASGTIAAILLTSTLGWALTVSLPRLSGGVIWLVLLSVVLTVSGDWRAALIAAAEGHGSPLMLALVFVLCPFFLVGLRLDPAEMLAVLPGLVLGAAAVVAACAWIVHMDIGLEVSQ